MKNFDLKTSDVYFRGEFVPFKEANLNITSSPVLYGLSIYTVFAVSWNKENQKLYIFRLKDHYKRLVNSARIMNFHNFQDHCSFTEFQSTMKELLTRNKVEEDVLVRATIFIDEIVAGTKLHGLTNSWSAYITPMGEILPLSGINVCVSSWARTPDNSIPARAKVNGNYVNASLMKNEALRGGFDDAIALDHNGHVSEGTVTNVFLVRDGGLITPDSSSDILEGITRDSIIKIADNMGLDCQERTVDRTELYVADEVFFCGSSARITPVLSVDKRRIGNGEPGKITKDFMQYLEALQRGQKDDFQSWLTIV